MRQSIMLLKKCSGYIGLLSLIFTITPAIVFCQPDSTKAKEEKETIAPTVEFTATQRNDNTIDLKASYKAKIKGTFTKLAGLHVMFYTKQDSADKLLGMTNTNGSGVALINVKAGDVTPDAEGKLHFKASFGGNKKIDASDDEVGVKRARLDITPVKGDSTLSVQLKLVDLTTGNETAIPETGLNVFVKRLFNPLKLGEGKTDASGEALVDIPKNLPGDAKGNIILLARLEDNEDYGNLEASTVQQWGIPVSDEIKEMPRALWSTHPPLWMLITFVVLVTTVWGHYIVIVYELFRLRKEQPDPSTQEVNNQ